jgi:orotate phosphoribosyltransferase-like protein
MKDTDTRNQFIELRAKGKSYAKISTELGVSKPTLLRWSAELSKEISEAKILEVDGIIEEFALTKLSRIRAIARHLVNVESELSKRDLCQVKTEKLVELALHLGKNLDEEIVAICRTFEVGTIQIPSILEDQKVEISAFD